MPERAKIDLLRTKPVWRALALLPWLACVLIALAAASVGEPAWLTPLIHLSGLGVAAQWYIARHTGVMRREEAELRIEESGVWQGQTLLLPRDELRQGFLRPDERHGLVLHLERKGKLSRDLRLAVDDDETARAALRTLGVDASQKVATLRAASRVYSYSRAKRNLAFLSPLPLVFATVLAMKWLPVLGLIGLVALMPLLLAWMLAPSSVDVGVDGVLVRWLGTRRFVAFERVSHVEHFEERDFNKVYLGVRLYLDDGSVERIVTGQKRFDGDTSKTLHARIEQALEAYRRGAGDVDASALARRDQRPLDWVRSLRALSSDAQVGPRRAPVAPERLLRVAVDPSASPTARASAAVAVAPVMTPEDRAKLRVATETTASPKLRVALEAALSPHTSEEALAEALAELEGDEGSDRRTR